MSLILLILISVSSYGFERRPEENFLPPKDQTCRAFANQFLSLQGLGTLENPSENVAITFPRAEERQGSYPSFKFTSNSGHVFRGQTITSEEFNEPGYKVSIYEPAKPLTKKEKRKLQKEKIELDYTSQRKVVEYVFKMRAGKCVLAHIDDYGDFWADSENGHINKYDKNACKLIRNKYPPASQKYRMCRSEYMGFFYSNPDDDTMSPDFSRVSKKQNGKNGKSQRPVK